VYPLVPTDPAWTGAALADLPALLADHLHCERKAATTALALVRAYPERADLVLHLSRLAHEETSHLVEVGRHLRRARGQATRDAGDPYAQSLRSLVRPGEPRRQLDLLLVSGLIEARSAERLDLLAAALRDRDPELAAFYAGLATAEHRHRDIFLALARPLADAPDLEARVAELTAREAEVVAALPWGPRIH
jgi:tRNA-(ms[2]io[6]A)-hydroxylase